MNQIKFGLFSKNLFLQVSLHSPIRIPSLDQQYVLVSMDRSVLGGIVPHVLFLTKGFAAIPVNKRKCLDFEEKSLKFFKLYTRTNCYLECLTNYTLSVCGCVKFHMPS